MKYFLNFYWVFELSKSRFIRLLFDRVMVIKKIVAIWLDNPVFIRQF